MGLAGGVGLAGGGPQEFEFNDDADTLELGDLGPSLGLDNSNADLPAPADQYAGGFDEFALDDGQDGFDLPAPARVEANDDFDLPAPVGGVGSDFDLPAPASDLPAALDAVAFDQGLGFADLPVPAGDDFPAPVDDFPAPIGGLPSPNFDELDDFEPPPPRPRSGNRRGTIDLPTAADLLPTPAGELPRSADILPTPVETLGLDLDLDDDDQGLRAVDNRAVKSPGTDPGVAAAVAAATGVGVSERKPSASAATVEPKRDVTRYVVYGLVGLAVLGFGGWYVGMEMGLFEPEPPPPPMASNDGGDEQPTPPGPGAEATERPEAMLAKFDLDSPAAYIQVEALAEGSNDQVAEAEAALLLHVRYGPDPTRATRAGQLLGNYPGASEAFVRRVVGLGLLGAGKLDEALAQLDGDDPRSQLYRSWVLLEQGKHDEARAAAEAALAKRPNDQAAQLAVLSARYAANPVDGLAAMRQAAGSSPNHLALQVALLDAASAQGQLAEAAKIGEGLDLGAVGTGYKAELLRRRAELARRQGRTGDAMRLLEQSLAIEDGYLPARLDRIQLWLDNKDSSAMRTEVDLLTRDHPSDPAVLKLAARTDLQAGRDDEAREWLSQLGEAGQTDPEVHDILGVAHTYTNKITEAQAAFAEARKLDPLYVPAIVHEAELLVRDQAVAKALVFLDEQQQALTSADARTSTRGRAALAAIARQRARIQHGEGHLELALSAAEEAYEIDAGDNEALLLRARLLGELGRRPAYEEALLELNERTGGFPGLTEPLGEVYLRKGKLAELDALIGSSLDDEDAARELLLTGAALRIAQGKVDQAKRLAQKVLDRDPTDSRAHLLLGRALLAEGDYTRALTEIESATTLEGDPEVELWLGQALEYNQQPGEARGHYQRALELDPNNLEAAALLGRLYAYEGAARKALDLLAPVVEQTDDYPYAWLAVGLAQRDLNQRDAAVGSFQKAQELDPNLFEAYYQEGRIHNDQNKHSAAIKALQAGVDKALDFAQERQLVDAYRRLGESYYEAGRRSEAKTAFEAYLKVAPANAAGRREVERLMGNL